jgi:hypothetical protein
VDRIPLRQGRRTSVNCSIATSKNLASACGVSRGGGTRKRRHAAGAARGHPWRGQRPSVPALSKRSPADAGKYDKESQGILTKPARVDLHRLNQLGKDLRQNGPSRRTSLGQPSSIVVRPAPVARKLPVELRLFHGNRNKPQPQSNGPDTILFLWQISRSILLAF